MTMQKNRVQDGPIDGSSKSRCSVMGVRRGTLRIKFKNIKTGSDNVNSYEGWTVE